MEYLAPGSVTRVDAVRRVRGSDSPLIERITWVTYERQVAELSIPDGCWDLVVLERGGRRSLLQTGVLSKPVQLENGPGDGFLCISFKPGVFMPGIPPAGMVDRAFSRPLVTSRKFQLGHDALEIPSFENADDFVARLVRAGLLQRDEVVQRVVAEQPPALSPRAVQRHFLESFGLTAKQFSQIQRARRALQLLQAGRAPVGVALELGYADQAHLTRSLKRFMGQTPRRIGAP